MKWVAYLPPTCIYKSRPTCQDFRKNYNDCHIPYLENIYVEFISHTQRIFFWIVELKADKFGVTVGKLTFSQFEKLQDFAVMVSQKLIELFWRSVSQACNFIKKKTLAQVFLWIFKISQNTFSYRNPPVAVSEIKDYGYPDLPEFITLTKDTLERKYCFSKGLHRKDNVFQRDWFPFSANKCLLFYIIFLMNMSNLLK